MMDTANTQMDIKILFLILCVFLFTSCASLESNIPVEKPSIPQITFQETIYDFGFAGPEQKIVHTFKFTNAGSQPLKIEKVSTDCGCTAALVSDKLIPPGGNGEIRAVLETRRFEGKQEKHVMVYSNVPETPETILTIKGTIKQYLVVVPQGVSFGKIKRGEPLKRSVRLFQLSNDRLILRRIEADNNFYKVTTSRFSEENSQGFDIDITLRPDVPLGILNDVITLHTNVKKRPRIDVMIWADVKE